MSFFESANFAKVLEDLRAGSIRTNDTIIDELIRTEVADEAGIIHATRLACELMTKIAHVHFVSILGRSRWREDLFAKDFSNNLMCRLSTPNEFFVFELYEEDFGSTRETVLFLDSLKDPHAVPYLDVFLRNAAKNIFKTDQVVPSREQIQKMFGPGKTLKSWCETQIAQGQGLKHFGGQTNTRLGLYAQLFRQLPELKECFIDEAEANIDLGGGFATPEISKILGRSFTSFDLESPQKAFDWELQFQADETVPPDDGYLERLHLQPFRRFDVFTDDFPSEFQSYNICSFGFLNSTVTSLSPNQPELPRNLRKFSTMFHGVYRIMRLVSRGKEIALLTFGRPDSNYMNRALAFRFSAGRVLDVKIPDHFLAYQPFMSHPVYGTHKLTRTELARITTLLEMGEGE